MNKQAVASAFSRAAGSYDALATVQREVGARLLGKQVTALDLGSGMLAFARQQQAADHYFVGGY